MKKILYIVLDGLADTALKALGNKTPLEAARRPYMDALCQQGRTGLVYPLGRGKAPASDIAVISLLGYKVEEYYTGRGPLEAFAEHLDLIDGNLALRVNFASVEADGATIKDRRVGRDLSFEEASLLAKEINTKVTLSNATFEFKNTVGHRGVLVIKGMHSKLSGWITNTDPAYDRENLCGIPKDEFENSVVLSQVIPGHESPSAEEAALLLNEFTLKSRKVLEESAVNKKRITDGKLPANIILSRDAGDSLPQFPGVGTLYGMKFGCFVEMPVERGIALLTGMEIVDIPQSTGHLDVDYPIWVKVALDAIKNFDGLYLHIKGPDDPSHDGDCKRKKEIIELIDTHFFGTLLKNIKLEDYIICVTSDHASCCQTQAHSADPVPILVAGGSIKPDGTKSFFEKSVRHGSLGELKGQDILPLLVRLAKE